MRKRAGLRFRPSIPRSALITPHWEWLPEAGPIELLRVQGFEMVRASGNAPDPGTDLVRCGV